VDSTLLREAIATETIGMRFNKHSGKEYLKNEKDFNAYVFKKVGNDSLSITRAIGVLTESEPIDSLASHRSEVIMKKVNSYLQGNYPITTIKIKQGNSDAPENSGAYPKFLITYGIVGEEEPIKDAVAN
jgi:hypothetical protein